MLLQILKYQKWRYNAFLRILSPICLPSFTHLGTYLFLIEKIWDFGAGPNT